MSDSFLLGVMAGISIVVCLNFAHHAIRDWLKNRRANKIMDFAISNPEEAVRVARIQEAILRATKKMEG